MAEPKFDPSTGWWYIRYQTAKGGKRTKKPLMRDARWQGKDGRWPPKGKRPTMPSRVAILAQPFIEIDMRAKLGQAVELPRQTELEAFLADYRTVYELNDKPTSLATFDQAVASFLKFCRSHKITALEQVTRGVALSYLEWLAAQPGQKPKTKLAHNTIKTRKGVISSAFTRAMDKGLLPANPWARLKIPVDDRSEGTPSYTQTEVDRIHAALNGWHKDMFFLGVNTGFRADALRGLQWKNIRWTAAGRKRGYIVCPLIRSKGGKEYKVPLFDPIHDMLAARREALDAAGKPTGPDDLVFPGQGKTGRTAKDSFVKSFRRACRRARVKYRGYPFHAMRATFATLCHARGINPRTIQAWMGHSSIKQTDRYSHHSSESDDAQADRFEGSPGEASA